MSKMGLCDPLGWSKHKLWAKESVIWLLTIKSWESPWLPCVRVMCNISLKNYQQGLQLFFKLHLKQRFAHSYAPPKLRESQFREFWDSHFGVLGQNDIWVMVPWLGTKYTIRGKVVASPKFRSWWVLWVRVCMWFVPTPKVLQLCIN